jgi:hypothetical protein
MRSKFHGVRDTFSVAIQKLNIKAPTNEDIVIMAVITVAFLYTLIYIHLKNFFL